MGKKTPLLLINNLGHRPGGGREYRLISPETLQTKFIVITDDCGQGASLFRQWNDGNRMTWERLSSQPATFKARYFAEMSKRLLRTPIKGPDNTQQVRDDMGTLEAMADRYPHLLRGCDLDSNAELHDLRHYDKPDCEQEQGTHAKEDGK